MKKAPLNAGQFTIVPLPQPSFTTCESTLLTLLFVGRYSSSSMIDTFRADASRAFQETRETAFPRGDSPDVGRLQLDSECTHDGNVDDPEAMIVCRQKLAATAEIWIGQKVQESAATTFLSATTGRLMPVATVTKPASLNLPTITPEADASASSGSQARVGDTMFVWSGFSMAIVALLALLL
jgi:hypothetical protein